ncbi:MAG: hypothetical protein U0744_08585 [Gemmataceae bacterium]
MPSSALGDSGAAASLLPASESPARGSRVKSIIFLHQFGGPSHVDTFDMKPDMPDQIRGIYRPMASSPCRNADLRSLAADGEGDGQGLSHPLDAA